MSVTIKKVIVYPGIPASGSFSGLTDTSFTSPAQGAVLYFDGTDWVNLAAGTAGNPLKTGGAGANPSFSPTISVNTVNESTDDNGVNVDGVVLKDGGITSTGAVTHAGLVTFNGQVALPGITITGNPTFLGTDITFDNEISVDTISEKSANEGVTVDSVLLKDGGATFTSGITGTTLTTSGAITATGAISSPDLLGADIVSEYTDGEGVTVDSVLLKDGGATFTSEVTGTDVTLSGNLTGIAAGKLITVHADHSGATDTRTGLSDYDPNRPFVTVAAAVSAASDGDIIVINSGTYNEDVTVTNIGLTFIGLGAATVNSITHNCTVSKALYIFNVDLNKSGSASLIQAGTLGTVLVRDALIQTSSSGAAITQASSNHFCQLDYTRVVSVDDISVTGTLNLQSGSLVNVALTGSGIVGYSSGAVVDGSIAPSLAESSVSGDLLTSAVKTNTISEITSGSGVTVDGVILKDGGGTCTSSWRTSGNTRALTNKTGAYTATSSDDTITCDASSAAFTISLPSAASNVGRVLTIKKKDSSVNAITIDPSGTETIDGASTYALSAQYDSVTIQSDAFGWQIIAVV